MTRLFLELGDRPEPTKSLRLQAALRDTIRIGRLTAGDRLPSTRALASELGWARNVVVDAYDQLNAEGYLTARAGDGTRVAPRPIDAAPTERTGDVTAERSEGGGGTADRLQVGVSPPIHIDLQPGLPDLVAFPVREWRRSLNAALTTMPVAELGYSDGTGAPILREAVAAHLARTRAIGTDPARVLITTGVSASLRLLVADRVAAAGSARVAVEDPGAYTQWDALRAAGAELVPVPVDDQGIRTDRLERVDADIVVVTPAHQYPLGGVLSPERRHELVTWARSQPGRLIVEDDYDAEFRYDRQPVGAVAGIAPEVTAHTGSVSKTLAPGLRIGWLHLPTGVAERVGARLRHEFVTPDAVQQHALADLLTSGAYDRIVRSRRRTYRKRRRAMITALDDVPGATTVGAAGGLHVTVLLPDGIDDRAVSETLLAAGIDVPPLSRYRLTPGPPGLVASFAATGEAASVEFADALARIAVTNDVW